MSEAMQDLGPMESASAELELGTVEPVEPGKKPRVDVLNGHGSMAEMRAAAQAALAPDAPTPLGDDLGVEPMPSTMAARTDPNVALATHKATTSGLSAADGAEVLRRSDATGLGPAFVAKDLQRVRQQDDAARLKASFDRAPVLASYAAQSPAHAAAVKDDAEHLSVIEYWITGKWRDVPSTPATDPNANVVPYARAGIDYRPREMIAPPVWQSGLAKFAFGLGADALTLKKVAVGLTDEEKGRLSNDVEMAGASVAGADGSGLRKAGATAAEMLPYLLTAPASKPAQATAFTLQAFPGYYRTLSAATDEFGDPRFTDAQAKAIASSAALTTGIGSSILGGAFLKAIPGAAQRLNGLLGESIVQAFTQNPTLAKVALARGIQAVPHMASGVAMMTASGAVNGGVRALADGHSLLSADGLAQVGQGAADGGKTGAILSLLALYGAGRRFQSDVQRLRGAAGPEVMPAEAPQPQPLLPAGETTIETEAVQPGARIVQDVGRAVDSGTESAQLDALTAAAKQSGLVRAAPREAQRLLAQMAQDGEIDTAYIHLDATKNPDVAAAIDGALSDGGQARALAEATDGTVAVPIETYLTLIAPDHHEAIREHVKLSPDGMTPREAAQALPALQRQMEALQEPLTAEKLNALAARGEGGLPSEAEINGVLESLRALGFDVPDLAPVKLGGVGEEAPAARPRREGPRVDASPIPATHLEAARSIVDDQRIGQIRPRQHALAARQAADRLAKIQAQAIEQLASAEQKAQEGLSEAVTAAETARSGAQSQALGTGMQAASEVPGIGRQALKNAASAMRASEQGQARAEDKSVAATQATVGAGDKLADVPAIEAQRDLARALAKVSGETLSEMARAHNSLRAIGRSQEIRAQLGLADPAFRDVVDALTEAVGARGVGPSATRRSVDDLLQTLQARRLPVPFDEQVVRDTIASPTPWKSLKPTEARDVARAVASLVKMGKGLNEVAVGQEKLALAEAKARVAQENAGRKDLGAPAATRGAMTTGEQVNDAAAALNAWNLKPEVAMQTLGPTMHGVFIRSIEGRNLKQDMQGEILRHFQEHVGELGWLRETLASGTTLQMPRLGDDILAPPPEDNDQRQGSVSLPRALARRYGSTPEDWEKLLGSDAGLEDLPTVRDIVERARDEWQKSRTVQTVPDLKDRYNKETVAMLFLNLGSPGNEQRLTSGYNWSGQQVRAEIGKHLTLEQVDQLQGILSFFDRELWPRVLEHAERTTGLAPEKVQAQPVTIRFADGRSKTYPGGYFPAAPHPDAIRATPLQAGAEAARATVSAAFTKQRAAQASYPIDLNFRRVGAHVDDVLHCLAYDEPVRDISKFLDDGGVQSVIRHSVGDANLKELRDWRDMLAAGEVPNNINMISRGVSRFLRSRAITNALSFNLPIAYMQASHIPFAIAAGEISGLNGAKAAARQIPFTPAWSALRDELSELRFRSTRYADQYREALSGKTALLSGKVARGIDHVAFLHMEAADAVVSHIIGDAALNDAVEKGMDRATAREYANAKIRLLMPSHNIFEMAAIGRNPGIVGTLALFRGLSNVVWNVNYNLYDRSRQALHAANRVPQKVLGTDDELPAYKELYEGEDGTWSNKHTGVFTGANVVRALSASALLGVLGFFFAGHGKDKDDGHGLKGWGKWALRHAIGSLLEAVPGGRDLGQPAVDAAVQGKSVDWALHQMKEGKYTPEMQTVTGLLNDLGRVASHNTTTPQKVQFATNATLMPMGLSLRPIAAAAANMSRANPRMRKPRGIFDQISQIAFPTRTTEKTPLNLLEDLVTGTE